MSNIQEKIQRQKEWVEHAKKSIQSYRRNDEIRHCPVCGIVPDDLDEFAQFIAQQAVEEYKAQNIQVVWNEVCEQIKQEERMRILALMPAKREVPHERPRRWNEHTERAWENGLRNEGFNDCLSQVKDIIKKK